MVEEKVTKKIKMPICEVCKQNVSVGVYCVPSVPISCAYCEECGKANAHPWWVLVSNTACGGGSLDKMALWWREMVEDTCKHLGKTLDEFNSDVQESVIRLDAYMKADYEKYCQKLYDDCEYTGTFINCAPKVCEKCHAEDRINLCDKEDPE